MRLILCSIYVSVGALLFALPDLTRRELLFAVPVPPDFRQTQAARNAIQGFHIIVAAAVLAGAGTLLLVPTELLTTVSAGAQIGICLIAILAFYRGNRKIAPAAVQFTRFREAELTDAPDKLPRFVWFAAGPFLLLAAAAVWLYHRWGFIPARWPVHVDAAGHANRWAERTPKGVYGPLLFGFELCVWLLVVELTGWFGSRRSHARSVMLGAMIAIQYVLALLFALAPLQPPLSVTLTLLATLVPIIIVTAGKLSDPRDPIDPTPNECWTGAVFYFNPNDAALFVEKRDGIGYTFNFANRGSWALLFGLAVLIASAAFVMP